MSRPEITSLTKLVQACENELGCRLPEGPEPEWKRRIIEVSKIKARQRKDPRMTLANLVLCLDYCLAHDFWPTSAVGITYKLDDALEAHRAVERERVDDYLGEAIAVERSRADLFSETWISRLSRAQGAARHDVLIEWRKQRG